MAAASPADPATWGVALHEAKFNGLKHRWADTAGSDEERRRPVVLFMHGWPESWFSWRHQLKAVKAAGYRGVAPDMRGYGGTEAPEHEAGYNVYTLAGDMLGLLQHLGASVAALVGHDHGAMLGWKLAKLHPSVFVCYLAMSVPMPSRGSQPMVKSLRKFFGDERKPESDPRFFYFLHHQLPNAAGDYAQDTRAALSGVYFGKSTGERPVTSDKLFVEGRSEPMWRRMRPRAELPPWISQAEFDYYVAEFERAGWNGGLNWYRAVDLDWHATPQLADQKVEQPVAFIAGAIDNVLFMVGGPQRVQPTLAKACEQLDFVKLIEGAGHWVQQEKPQEVNEALLAFVDKHRGKLEGPAGPRSRL